MVKKRPYCLKIYPCLGIIIYIYIYRVQPTLHIWGLLAGLVSEKKKKKRKLNLIG